MALTKNDAEAKDLLQESLLKAIQHFDSLKEEAKFKSWLFKIITREFYALQNRELSKRTFLKTVPFETTELPAVFINKVSDQKLSILLKALNGLSAKERAAIVLFEVGGFSLEDIRQIQQERSLSAIKSRLSRGRTKLKELVQDIETKTIH